MTQLAVSYLLIALLQAPAPATQAPPARATIEGLVVRANTNEPVSRAQITITRSIQPGVQAQPAAAPPQRPGTVPTGPNPAPPVISCRIVQFQNLQFLLVRSSDSIRRGFSCDDLER